VWVSLSWQHVPADRHEGEQIIKKPHSNISFGFSRFVIVDMLERFRIKLVLPSGYAETCYLQAEAGDSMDAVTVQGCCCGGWIVCCQISCWVSYMLANLMVCSAIAL
jgi:hypothetical protein